MAKKSRNVTSFESTSTKTHGPQATPFIIQEAVVDPALALLFASSAGPVLAPPKSRYEGLAPVTLIRAPKTQIEDNLTGEDAERDDGEEDEDDQKSIGSYVDLESAHSDDSLSHLLPSAQFTEDSEEVNTLRSRIANKKNRKRKRDDVGDDLEGRYMLRLAQEEDREEAGRQAKRQISKAKHGNDPSDEQKDDIHKGETLSRSDDEDQNDGDGTDREEQSLDEAGPADMPLHETLAPDISTTEVEKSSRTVFLANVSTSAITDKKAKTMLLDHMGSFLGSLAPPKDGAMVHKVESIRFRSTAYEASLPKKAAYAKKALMAATTKSTNAYVVYSTPYAAREAVKNLNGSMVLDRHLRVDGVAHPAKTDHRRCVFVGNLGFVDDESMMDQGGETERKRSKIPSDVEEGLWRQFAKAGEVESVRVVRDEKTRVGKGFAYVQFKARGKISLAELDANAVEAALLFNEKKYPPMLPRVLRVTRAKAVKKTAVASQRSRAAKPPQFGRPDNPNNAPIYNPKLTSQQQSLQGRASKLLGRAAAAQLRHDGSKANSRQQKPALTGVAKSPESIVFEGYRASAKAGRPKDLKFGKGGVKRQGRPKTRSSKRGAEWKKGGGKKAK
ncbi:MAG: Nucleolar protein 12 [Claussenomyces sp. TS43310]|nr:MAG: Nucleolar protein 12 [Claussenomyces sp. TS43310]